jgi:carboxylate-amine ligase
VKAAAAGSPVDEHLVGELIASEAEVRTGRCVTWAEASERMGERRAQLSALVAPLGISLAATGTHPWSRWQDQRIIDTPHYRRNDKLLRYVVWRNNTFGLHVHVGFRAPTVRSPCTTACGRSSRTCSRSPRARRSSRA